MRISDWSSDVCSSDLRRGNFARAIDLLEQAVQLEPAEPTINEHLGDAYWQVGRRYEARYSWRAAMVGAEEEDVLARLRRKIDFGLAAGDDSAQCGRAKPRLPSSTSRCMSAAAVLTAIMNWRPYSI